MATPQSEHSVPGLNSPPITQKSIPGISPSLLIKQVRNTVPFIFKKDSLSNECLYLEVLRKTASQPTVPRETPVEEAIVPYFALNLSAHFATVASFVPTDVDNQIRHKIWQRNIESSHLEQMSDWVRKAQDWDIEPVSSRFQTMANGERLSGHSGEWFSVAVAAYAKTKVDLPTTAKTLLNAMIQEWKREFSFFEKHRDAGNGIELLKSATTIAHNLGDFNRVMEMWELGESDALRSSAETLFADSRMKKLGEQIALLNREMMAVENHRHFALRVPKGLRQSPELLLPIGPFFDQWGRKVATHSSISENDLSEIVQALIDGWGRLKGPVGYARALSGILEGFPGGFSRLKKCLPARTARAIQSGPLRPLLSISEKRFEASWDQTALKKLRSMK